MWLLDDSTALEIFNEYQVFPDEDAFDQVKMSLNPTTINVTFENKPYGVFFDIDCVSDISPDSDAADEGLPIGSKVSEKKFAIDMWNFVSLVRLFGLAMRMWTKNLERIFRKCCKVHNFR